MHEAAIAQSIIDIAAGQLEEGGYRRVTRIAVKVGHLSSIVPESLQFAFQALARGTAAEAATLQIEEVEGRARCRSCGEEFATDSYFTACEACGSADVDVSGGDELTIESMDVER